MASSVVSHLTIPLALCWRVGSYPHGRGVGDISIGEVKGYVRGLRCLKLGAERHSQAPVVSPGCLNQLFLTCGGYSPFGWTWPWTLCIVVTSLLKAFWEHIEDVSGAYTEKVALSSKKPGWSHLHDLLGKEKKNNLLKEQTTVRGLTGPLKFRPLHLALWGR